MGWKFKLSAKARSMMYVSTGGLIAFSGLSIYTGNEQFYERYLMPLVQRLDPETSHQIAVIAAKYGLVPKCKYGDTLSLKTSLWQLDFSNPIGIAAGFDKQGEAISGLHKIGFGFVEIGSVTPLPQEGNEKPRVFRLAEEKAIINRYGFNSDGHAAVLERVQAFRASDAGNGVVVGINLGKNRSSADPVADYVLGVEAFGAVADYLVVNVSSPNTPGLRAWQGKARLTELLAQLIAARDGLSGNRPPLLLKLAPDLTSEERQDVATVIADGKCRVDGLVVSNTTVARDPGLSGPNAHETGGLSGQPLKDRSTQLIADMYRLTKGSVPIVGVGGVFSGRDAYEKIRAGASLVQLYTALAYHGPPVVARIKKELDQLLRADGFHSVAEAVGKDSAP